MLCSLASCFSSTLKVRSWPEVYPDTHTLSLFLIIIDVVFWLLRRYVIKPKIQLFISPILPDLLHFFFCLLRMNKITHFCLLSHLHHGLDIPPFLRDGSLEESSPMSKGREKKTSLQPTPSALLIRGFCLLSREPGASASYIIVSFSSSSSSRLSNFKLTVLFRLFAF